MTGSDMSFHSFTYCPNCIYCQLSPEELIEKAAGEAEIPLQRAWDDYLNGHNTITPIPCGFRVRLRLSDGGFLNVDILEEL